MFEYEINGKKYIQKKLVWGQVEQLQSVLAGIVFPADLSPISLMGVLGSNLPRACAIFLSEEGVNPKDKDLDALTEEFKYNLDLDLSLDILVDFFDCTPVDSLLKRLAGLTSKFTSNIVKKNLSAELNELSPSLPEETLPKETE
jgi:hypothetical protein